MPDGQINFTNAQSDLKHWAEWYKEADMQQHVSDAIAAAAAFLEDGSSRHEEGTGDLIEQPLFSEQEIGLLNDKNGSAFLRAGNAQVFRLRIFTNAINHALYQLDESGLFEENFLADQDEMLFHPKTIGLLELLERRRQGNTLISQMTITEVVLEFHSSKDSKNTQKVRDHYLVPLAKMGLVTGTYTEGHGYMFRSGPILEQLVPAAVEPAFQKYNL